MAIPERKPVDPSPENSSSGFKVLVIPNKLYEAAGDIAEKSRSEAEHLMGYVVGNVGGQVKKRIISETEIDGNLLSREKTTIIGGYERSKGLLSGIVTYIEISENKKASPDHGYFSLDKLELIKKHFEEKGLATEITPEMYPPRGNSLKVTYNGEHVWIFMGFGSREEHENYIKSNKIFGEVHNKMRAGLENEYIKIRRGTTGFGDDAYDALPVEEKFGQDMEVYSRVFETLVAAIYKLEEEKPPIITVTLSGSEVEKNEPQLENDWEGFEAIAGQDEAVAEAKKLVQAIKNPEIFKKRGVKVPKGILFYGPPGTGKTLLAKAIAKEAGVKFMDISTADIEIMWRGESERNLQKIFDDAKNKGKTILFFDEFDSLMAPRNGINEFTGKIIGVFNQNMDGIRASDNVTVIAATNKPEGVDLAVKRSGRFDKLIEVGLPNEKGRVAIFKKHAEKAIKASAEPESLFVPNLDYDRIAKETNGMSGADLANLVNRTLETKLAQELEGKGWMPISTDEILDMAYKIILERTEKTEIRFDKKQ